MRTKQLARLWPRLAVLGSLLASVGSYEAYGQVTLYDNTGGGPVSGPQLDPGDRFLAQQFLTGPYDTVSSITVALQRKGAPSGQINLAIWDENESGLPGNPVDSLGSIDFSSLSTAPGFVTLDNLVTGLNPDTAYYVVLDTPVIPSRSDTIRFGTLDSNEGTNGASKLRIQVGDRWPTVDSLLGPNLMTGERANYWQMSVTGLLAGDFDGDGMLTTKDIDMLTAEIYAGTNSATFDLIVDGIVDDLDLTKWRTDGANHNGFSEAYLLGDSDLDGSVDATDLNNLALNWRQSVSEWSGGDFATDGFVDSADLNALALNWRQSISLASAAHVAVPEPSAWWLACVGLVLVWRRRNRN